MVEKRRSLSADELPAGDDGRQRKKQSTERDAGSPSGSPARAEPALVVVRPGDELNELGSSSSGTAADSARPMSVDLPTPTPTPTPDEGGAETDAVAMEVDDEPTAADTDIAAAANADAARHPENVRQAPAALAVDAEPAAPDDSTLAFHHFLPVLSTKARVITPALTDALGCEWRIVWYPRGVVDSEYVSVFVQMVVDERRLAAAGGEAARHAEVEIVLRHQRDASGRSNRVKTSTAHAFSRETHEFGVSNFVRRSELLSPESAFLAADSRVGVDITLRFVAPDPLAANPEAVESDRLASDRLAMAIAAQQLQLGPHAAASSLEEATVAAAAPDERVDGAAADDSAESMRQLLAYDSKQETGMVGLKNQGATCYLNSLLQTLFHLRAFRQVVYETPSRSEDTTESVSLALQRVFYRLQRQRKAVSTKELTRAFGWSQIDAFMQHDVQELYRILCDRLEEKMKNTMVDSAIKRLFEGRVRSFVRCVHVDFQSSRDESFYDLQLDVKGCRDIYESFRKYVEAELLTGDNQYEAEGYGKQDARKGVRFLHLPPVLNIQLKRFEYDAMRDGMVKIHDRFEFPTTLVLDEFLQERAAAATSTSTTTTTTTTTATTATKSATAEPGAETDGDGDGEDRRHIYHLHSVLVHSGDVHGGHYYVFTRPAKDLSTSSDWFRFDDDQITRVDERAAVEGSFGSAPAAASTASASRPASPLYSSSLLSSPDATAAPDASGLEFRSMDAPGTTEGQGADHDRGEEVPVHGAGDVYEYSRVAGIEGEGEGEGDAPMASGGGLSLPLARNFSSAYMLVYVRDGNNDISAIGDPAKAAQVAGVNPSSQDVEMAECEAPAGAGADAGAGDAVDGEADGDGGADAVAIPRALVERFQQEEKEAARRKKLQQTEHLFMNLRVASDASVASLRRFSKSVDFSQFGSSACLRVRMRRAAPIRELYRRVYRRSGVPVDRQRLWKVITRENRTHRPDQPLLPDVLDLRVDSLIDDDASPKAPVRLFLQILPPRVPAPPRCVVNRFDWSEFSAPESETEKEEDGEDGEAASAGAGEDVSAGAVAAGCCPEMLGEHEILLFVKCYDLSRALGERLEYKGNLIIDARRTGAELAAVLREALRIPAREQLLLFEEIQPTAVQEIDADTTLAAAEIQHGDIICYQLTGGRARVRARARDGDRDRDLELDADKSKLQDDRGKDDGRVAADERYPDVPAYFRYLLDRVEVVFQRYGRSDERFVLELLQSNTYDEVVAAVAARLGLARDRLRLYQHSPLNGLPMRSPLRHERHAGPAGTTLEELLTEYLERTSTMYFEELPCSITELEAKKQLRVVLSAYDACFADAGGGLAGGGARQVELLVAPTDTARELRRLVRQQFALPDTAPLRVCEVAQHGTVVRALLGDDAPLERFWADAADGGGGGEAAALMVERVPEDEVDEADECDASGADGNVAFVKSVVHFHFQGDASTWIRPHGAPLVVRFREQETIAQVKARIRRRLGVAPETFDRWNLALVKDLKATTVRALYDELDAEAVDALPMARLEEVCGTDFENISGLGLEHAEPSPKGPAPPRHREQGIRIRQN